MVNKIEELKRLAKSKGYTAREGYCDDFIISLNDYHHVSFKMQDVLEAPADFLMQEVDYRMDLLKRGIAND